ncbi:hypothetical protein JCM3774_000008 [Rhodotorula dairenensis]
MAIAHTPNHTPQRYHYARLLCTPVTPAGADLTAALPPADRATVLQLLSRVLQDLYGTMGGPVAFGEVDVVAVETLEKAFESGSNHNSSSEVVIRFPAGATHAILTALPLATSPPFRLSIQRHSSDLARLAGTAGRGPRGYLQWARATKGQVQATAASEATQTRGTGASDESEVEMQQQE